MKNAHSFYTVGIFAEENCKREYSVNSICLAYQIVMNDSLFQDISILSIGMQFKQLAGGHFTGACQGKDLSFRIKILQN